MSLAQALFLGFIQGITEWLPVSSSAQTILYMTTVMGMGLNEALQLMIYLHVGTACAAILYFVRDIINIFLEIPKQIRNKNFF